jgi:hypothetical protein
MFSFKFKLLIFFVLINNCFGAFDESCLGSSFKTKIVHKVGPFSLLKNELGLTKEVCTLNIIFKKWNLFEKKWLIDYCRMPIHIKYGNGYFDVFKREQGCNAFIDKKEKPEFCRKKEELENILSDEGLIFANGIKEDISSDHGKVYCSFLILKSYLDDGIVYESVSQKLGELGSNPRSESQGTPTF